MSVREFNKTKLSTILNILVITDWKVFNDLHKVFLVKLVKSCRPYLIQT